MATYAKDTGRIRVNGGNNVKIKFGSSPAWNSVGHTVSGKIVDSQDSIEVVFADGESIECDGKRKCSVNLIIAQSSKDEIEMVDVIRNLGKNVELYIYNGIVDGYYQEFYFKECKVIGKTELAIEGNKHMQVALDLSAQPQATNCAVSADALPTDAKAYDASEPPTYTGVNHYYVCIETAVPA